MATPQLDQWFTYHPPVGNQANRYVAIRAKALALAVLIDESVLDSDEKTLAFACLRQSVMWANAGIACNEEVP